MSNLRLFFIGGLISYRALFNWIRPIIYIPTMLGSPFFQLLFFVYLGRFSGVRDDSFFVVGNAVQMCAISSIFGATMSIANERYFGTLSALLATPANRIVVFLGRATPFILNGLFVSAFGFVMGTVLTDFSLAPGTIPALSAVVVVTVISCTALGMLLGSIGLRARDVFFSSNLTYFLMLLFCGVNIPLESLPIWMQSISQAVPLTHGIQAAREIAVGASLSQVGELVWTEALIAVIYGTVAFATFRFFELTSRHTASLETR
jgi:ABC-2 type transport system permease protein